MKNYSRQREAILDCLHHNRTHPTADNIYQMVRERLPNISLGTVYRNLSQLVEDGEIISIDVGDGFLHYDGCAEPHIHFHCRKCRSIIDIGLEHDYMAEKISEYGFKTESAVYVIYGICKKCNKNIGGN